MSTAYEPLRLGVVAVERPVPAVAVGRARRADGARCARACFFMLLGLAVSLWTAWWGYAALQQYVWEKRCVLFSGPWLPCEPYDWKGPLLVALAPLALLGLLPLARLLAAPFRPS